MTKGAVKKRSHCEGFSPWQSHKVKVVPWEIAASIVPHNDDCLFFSQLLNLYKKQYPNHKSSDIVPFGDPSDGV